jgi:hypothetical protein
MAKTGNAVDVTPEQVEATMGDPLWRIRSLYRITDKSGRIIDFVPNKIQEQLLHDIFVDGCRRVLVLKSRKHGVSTLFEIIIFDFCYFGQNLQASIIDLTHSNASDKLVKICRFAWDNLDPDVKEPLAKGGDSKNVLAFNNGSNINAGKNARGGQNQILHVSEWGPIAHQDPERSTEIKTGALPSADEGIQLIESTFQGGKGGDFYELIKRTMETPESQKTAKDFRFRFFAWWQDERNTLEGDVQWIPKAVTKYLADIEARIGHKFTDGQKLWYYKTKQEQGIFMQREYPSTVDEAFNAPVEGSIYGQIISEIRAAGHVCSFSRDRGAPVFASWDLGWNDSMTVWLWQIVGRDTARHETMAKMYGEIECAEIPVVGHFLPHDGSHGNVVSGRVSPKAALEKAGAVNVIVVPQANRKSDGINLLRDLLARSWFNVPACEYGISALEAYHTKDETTNGVTSKEPVHDWSSHPSDAARCFAEALELGLVKADSARRVLQSPRSPTGEVIVDLEYIRSRSGMRRKGLAKSGGSHP